jgi:small-conductance mechanosensitive channel
MQEISFLSTFNNWISQYYVSILWSAAVVTLHLVIVKWTLPKIKSGVKISRLSQASAKKAFNIVRIIVGTITLSCLFIVWGIDFSGLLLISTSLITVTGVALFANWSLLSNITAYFILLFQPSYSRGNFVRIFEGDNFVEGTIIEVNLFNIRLLTDDNETITYPNNLILTRITMLNPQKKMQGFGKIGPVSVGVDGEVSQGASHQSNAPQSHTNEGNEGLPRG